MKPIQVHPYLIFAGRCEEALDFYRTALGMITDHFGVSWMIKVAA